MRNQAVASQLFKSGQRGAHIPPPPFPLPLIVFPAPFSSFPLPFSSFPLPFSSFPRKRESSESQFKWIPGQAGDDGLLAGFAWHHGASGVRWDFRSAMGLPGHHGISGVPRGGAGAPRGFPGAMNVAPTPGNFCAFSIIFELST